MPARKKEQVNVGERLVQLIQQSLHPYLSPALEPYVGLPVDVGDQPDEHGAVPMPPRIHVRMTHETVKEWILAAYYTGYQHTVLPKRDVESAIGIAKALTALAGITKDIPIRHHYDRDAQALYLDLGRKDMQMVKVTPGHWEVLTNRGEVNFRRPLGMGELPLPTPPGTGHICDLRRFLNCPPGADGDRNFYKLVAWLLGCFMPDGDRSVLVLNGGKGSGKSTIAKMLRNLIDPSEADLLQPPKDEAAIALRAFQSWVVAYDNLSKLDNTLSDSFCRLATGSVLTKRQLYTDDGEVIWKVKRPVIINGIQPLVVKDDLSQRALVVDLPEIPEIKGQKYTQSEYDQHFQTAWPGLLGALLDVVADGMTRLPVVTETTAERYRMGDFHLWIAACSNALGWEPQTATAIMEASKQQASDHLFDNETVFYLLNEYLWDKHCLQDDGVRRWRGTHQDMLKQLRDLALAKGLNVNDYRLDFPAKAQSLEARERRYRTELAAHGITITQYPHNVHGNRRYIWTLTDVADTAVPLPPYRCQHEQTHLSSALAG